LLQSLKGFLLKKHLLVVVALTAATAFAAFGSSLAGAAETAPTVTPTGTTDTIYIQDAKGALKFVAPASVKQGDSLEIVNETDPKKVGPHTFSLVTKGSVPKTASARKNCFTPKHICMSVAKWQGFTKDEKITINPAKAGAPGWSTLGSVTEKGDSWFTEKKNQTFSQVVSADPATTGTLYFICAVHPWMHGQVKVLPAGS
jgi:plastocyanin